ncbi:MAG: DsrE family protein [Nitrosomonas sp.]|nr:DsrE family protein [Nitrosomonas sp.]
MMQNRILSPSFWFLGFSLLFLTVFSLPGLAETADRYHQKQNVIVKLANFDPLTWEDPVPGGHNWQSACMAFMMADHMLGEAIGNSHYKNEVILFLNLQAVELADTDTAIDLSGFICGQHSLQESWDMLLHKGVDIVVCPGCAVIGGITPETLREGARIAGGAQEVTEIFLRADKVIDF